MKYALITGATSGIGLELARTFAQNNYNLLIVARNPEDLAAAVQELEAYGVIVIPYAKNLSNRQEVYSLCHEIKTLGVQVDVLVNNAGQGIYGEFKDTDVLRELSIIDLNIAAVVILTKYFLQEMLARKEGKILNLGSTAGKMPGPWLSVYHGTKAFIISFSEAIREEVKDSGGTVTTLMPGATDTDFFDKAHMEDSKIVQDKEKLASPAEVARAVYDALMKADDKVIVGFKNKIQVAKANIMPDDMVAHSMAEMQKPVDRSQK
jgi:short-subunit dehydrogenase